MCLAFKVRQPSRNLVSSLSLAFRILSVIHCRFPSTKVLEKPPPKVCDPIPKWRASQFSLLQTNITPSTRPTICNHFHFHTTLDFSIPHACIHSVNVISGTLPFIQTDMSTDERANTKQRNNGKCNRHLGVTVPPTPVAELAPPLRCAPHMHKHPDDHTQHGGRQERDGQLPRVHLRLTRP